MSKPLTKNEVIERLHVLPLESYALITNVAKGIALGVGSLVLVQILAKINVEWMRLLPWSASMVAVLLTYLKWTRGALLSNAQSSVWDSFIPLLMGVVECVMFAILAVENEAASTLWLNWPLCFAAHGLAAAALVNNRLSLIDIKRDFDDELTDLGKKYVEWLRKDRIQAGASGGCASLLWIVGHFWVLRAYGTVAWMSLVCVITAACFIVACFATSDANSQREWTDEFVTQKPKGGSLTLPSFPLPGEKEDKIEWTPRLRH